MPANTVRACAAVLAMLSFAGATAHAQDLGEPDVVAARNTGDTGVIAVFYDPPSGPGGRTIEAQCAFQLSPAVNSNTVSVAVSGTAAAHESDPADGSAAATGIRCELRSASGATVVESAVPGAVATANDVVGLRLTSLTLCLTASVLWSDALYQTMRTPVCVAPQY